MCTIGAVSNISSKGERLTFLMKTLDASDGHECVSGFFRASNGNQALCVSVIRQHGINIGLNQQELAVTMSYSDYKPRFGKGTDQVLMDSRALANAQILAECRSVHEGIEVLKDFVPKHPDQLGGNHLLIDSQGKIALLEQCEGKYEYREYSDEGYCSRANNSHWLIKDAQSKTTVPADSLPREKQMKAFLKEVYENIPKGMDGEEIIFGAKSLLSLHSGARPICVHSHVNKDSTLFPSQPVSTLSAIILEINSSTMHYSLGNPCLGNWKALALEVPDFSRPDTI